MHLQSTRRGPDFTAAANQVCDIAAHYGCDLIANCGDILNATRPSADNLVALSNIDSILAEYGIPMFCIDGNHDYSDPSWLEVAVGYQNVAVDRTAGIINANNQVFNLPGGLRMLCLPWMSKEALIARLAQEVERVDIIMWHGAVREFCGFPTDDNVAIADFKPFERRLVLLGDIHKRQFQTVDRCIIGYPGATELVKQDEPLKHSVTIFDIPYDPTADTIMHEVPLETRPAFAFRIMSEDQLHEVLAKLQPHLAKDPIIFIRYNPNITGIVGRLNAAIDVNKAFLRAEPINMDVAALGLEDSGTAEAEVKPLSEFVIPFFNGNLELIELASKLCERGSNPTALVIEYVDKKLAV